jgi:hypothetical protein
MTLTEDEVISLAISDTDKWIEEARKDHALLVMHFYGEGLTEYLTKVEGLENDAQIKLRKKFAISNRSVTRNLFRPLDNVFSAKGTNVTIDAPQSASKQIKTKLENVRGGMDIASYMSKFWKEKFLTDPNGLTFLEVKGDGSDAYLTNKSITKIKNMKVYGDAPEYVVFEPDVVLNGESNSKSSAYSLIWVVDSSRYYRVKVKSDKKTSEILFSIPNSFGMVPGVINSTMIDIRRGIRISPAWDVIELLNKHVMGVSVKEIFIAKHGFPIFWFYINRQKAKPINPMSGIDDQRRDLTDIAKGVDYKKDVSDGIGLEPPRDKDSPTIAPDVAGYISPPLETWREMRVELDHNYDLIYFTVWGNMPPAKPSGDRTATEVLDNLHHTANRLNEFSSIAQEVQKNLVGLFGKYVAPVSYKGCSVNYSRRFILETPDQLWLNYQNAKEKKAPESVLNQLLARYYEGEYQANDIMKEYYLKIIKIDPLPHVNISELRDMEVPAQIKLQKVYFNEWLNNKMIAQVIGEDLIKLQSELRIYVESKNIVNEKEGREED